MVGMDPDAPAHTGPATKRGARATVIGATLEAMSITNYRAAGFGEGHVLVLTVEVADDRQYRIEVLQFLDVSNPYWVRVYALEDISSHEVWAVLPEFPTVREPTVDEAVNSAMRWLKKRIAGS